MKHKLLFLLVRIIAVGALLVGLLLLWASFQSFEVLASVLNKLASDGELESFTLSLYQTLKLPLGLTGAGLIILAGLILLRWNQTKRWLLEFPARAGNFFSLLRLDTQSFLEDARNAIKSQGWGGFTVLVVLTLVALVMRLGNLDLALGHDEAYTYNAFASRSIWHIVSDYHLPNNHVFLSIIIHFTTRLLGDHIWAIRLPTIVAGALMVPATFWFAKRFYSNETAYLSATLVAIFPVLIKYAVYARGYTFICLITLLLLALGDYVRIKQNRFAWALIVIFSALGLFTIPIMLFPFGGLYVWLLVSWASGDIRSYESKFTFLKYWIVSGFSAAFVTIVLYLPIILNNSDRFFGNGFIAPLDFDIFPGILWTRLRNTWLEWTLSVPFWMIVLGVVGVFMALFLHKRFSRQKFPLQFAFIIWITVLLLARRPDMLPRFWLFLAAPILTWAAAGIVEPLRMVGVQIGKRWSLAQTFVGIAFVLVVVQALILMPSIPSKWGSNDGMANATIYLKDAIRQGDLVTATSARLPALRYYFDYYGLPKGYIRQAGQFQRAFIIVDGKKSETLAMIAPQLGFDIPAIDMDTVEIVYQQGDFTIYECYPAQ
jgi:4-amino-4-deoxy-L-arabinose transferase-like glycosyltransferase